MLRKFCLALAVATSAFAISASAWADFTVLVPSSSEGDGLRAAADDYSKMKGTKVEIVQAPYANVFEQGANAGATKSGVFDIILMDDPWIPFFAENGHLEDLTPYFKNAGMSRCSAAFPSLQGQGRSFRSRLGARPNRGSRLTASTRRWLLPLQTTGECSCSSTGPMIRSKASQKAVADCSRSMLPRRAGAPFSTA